MKLTVFRVKNYKHIRDTDWIMVSDLTVFVGKNEAGKSALFHGLFKEPVRRRAVRWAEGVATTSLH